MLIDAKAERDLAQRIHTYLRVTAAVGRVSETVGPFLATIDPESDNLYRNYAVPLEQASFGAREVKELAAWFVRQGRVPRLEYLPAGAPGLEELLLAGGFVAEGRVPLMVCAEADLRHPGEPVGFELAEATGTAQLTLAAAVQNEAYGAGRATEADTARLVRTVRAGGCVVLSIETVSGAAAGAGVFTAPAGGVTEIAGIGVAAAFRRRGVAAAVTAELTARAFARGIAFPFLTAGPGADGVYARVGYRACAEMLHISQPG